MEIKDKMLKVNMNTPKIPELEGRVKIELFNAETGKLEKSVEGKNMVTDVVKEVFASNYYGAIKYGNLMPIFKKFFSGVLCFQNTLTESASNYFPPLTTANPVIAHAGDTTYSSADADATRGIPNDIESGEVTNGYKYVWDFPATQGNGTISALALTNPSAGNFWMFNGTSFSIIDPINSLGLNGTESPRFENTPVIASKTAKRIYQIIVAPNSTSVKVRAMSGGIIENIGLQQPFFGTDYADGTNVLSKTFTFPSRADRFMWMYFESSDEIHAVYGSGTTLTKVVIALDDDVENWTMTTTTHTISGASMQESVEYTHQSQMSPTPLMYTSLDKNGYLYMWGTSSIYKIKYSNMSDVTEISAGTTLNRRGCMVGYGDYGISVYSGYVTDGNTVRILTTNSKASDRVGLIGCADASTPILISDIPNTWAYYGYTGITAFICNLFLSTIKNLDSAVTKTSTQTMKITYTITEAQASE